MYVCFPSVCVCVYACVSGSLHMGIILAITCT